MQTAEAGRKQPPGTGRKDRRMVDWPYVIGLIALPVVVVVFIYGVTRVQELARYDPAYFTSEFLERYESPGSVAIGLERALREGDRQLMDELLGTRRGSPPLEPRPSLIFVFLLDREGGYFQYLYFNSIDYHRVIQYVKEQDGRYVASLADLYFYMDSGRWSEVAAPIAATWWILVVVYTAATYVYRRMAAARKEMFDR